MVESVIPYRGDYALLVRGQTMFAEKRDGGRAVIQDSRLTPYLGDLQQGGWVVDYIHLLERQDIAQVLMNMPMPSVRMLPGQVVSVREGSSHLGSTRTRTRRRRTVYRGMDHVSILEYVQLWAIQGAKTGQRSGNIIVWSDGSQSRIPPARERWS